MQRFLPRRIIHSTGFLILTIVTLGICLRIPILSVAPLLETISHDLRLSSSVAGLLSTIPVLCFGTVALATPTLTRRWGMDGILLGMFLLILTGLLVRTLPPVWLLYGGTVLVGAGIAVSNVIMPGFIKREAPGSIGPMTAVYSAAISASGAIGAGLTVPIMHAFDLSWRAALRWPAAIVIVGVLMLLPWQVSRRSGALVRHGLAHSGSLWRNRIAWLVTGYMGMQSFLFFATTGWLPTYLISMGMGEQEAGFLLSASPLAGVAGSFIAPLLVNRRRDQRWLVWLSSAFCAAGLLGLVVAPMTLTVIWVLLFGFGSGMTLSIALTFIGLRTPDAPHAATLSMMSQSVGYTIAAIGPFGIGFIHDVVGNWRVPFLVILLTVIVLTLVGLGAGRSRLVTDLDQENQPVGG